MGGNPGRGGREWRGQGIAVQKREHPEQPPPVRYCISAPPLSNTVSTRLPMKSPTRPDQLSPKLYFLNPGVSPQDPRSGEGELAAGLFSGILSSHRPPPHCTTHTGPPCTIIISFVPESIKIRSCRTNFKTGFSCLIICDPHPQFGTAPTHRSMSTVFDCHQHAFAASVKFLYGPFLSSFHKKIKKPKR